MMWFSKVIFVFLMIVAFVYAVSDSQEKSRSASRHEGGTKECRYNRAAWGECNPKTNTRTRVITLKKGEDETKCEKTKTVEKKCKKVCRYEKGAWTKCNSQNEMTRTDTLRNPAESDSSCEKSKLVTKKCKNKVDRPGKGKGQKRKHQQEKQQSAHH